MAEIAEKWQKRQSDYGEMIALKAGEELDAETFDAVGADGLQHGLAFPAAIFVEKIIGKITHGQLGLVQVAPDGLAVARDTECGVEEMRLAAQSPELRFCPFDRRRLVKDRAPVLDRKSVV